MSLSQFIEDRERRGIPVTPELYEAASRESKVKFERITFKEAMSLGNNTLYCLAVWLGLICSPSFHYMGKCNVRRKKK